MNAVASCIMLEIPVAGIDERVVLEDLLALLLRDRLPASDEALFGGRVCFQKKSMDETEREEIVSRPISFICKKEQTRTYKEWS